MAGWDRRPAMKYRKCMIPEGAQLRAALALACSLRFGCVAGLTGPNAGHTRDSEEEVSKSKVDDDVDDSDVENAEVRSQRLEFECD